MTPQTGAVASPAAAPARRVRVWADSCRGPAPCHGPRCGAALVWYETVRRDGTRGRRICFDLDARIVAGPYLDPDVSLDRQVLEYDAAGVHFVTCPDKDRFRRPRPAAAGRREWRPYREEDAS